ncbi:hypothetical protein SAMD00019534_007000, partial [Acytostelium subglobosum LB1]|uniref:hypothetical protein n=1 Tax=Acytostelium subglobosum LB1 TaxID=1410327 RepID=UPI000644BDBB
MSLFDTLNDTTNGFGNFLEREINRSVNSVVLKLRTAVSKDKNRFINDQFNLDLTYITTRIIAMGYPTSDSLESSWRNPRDEVKRFLDTYHPEKYLILNLTEKAYDHAYFDNRVQHLGWFDHHSPSVGLLLYAVQIIHQWLSQDPGNVIAIHCAAGRGRTGTLICSYLVSTIMYEGQLDAAINLFAKQRSSIGEGITVPSQLRYVEYVNRLSTRQVDISLAQTPKVMTMNALVMKPIPNSAKGWKPVLEVYSVNMPLSPVLLFSNRTMPPEQIPTYTPQANPAAFISLNNIVISGDILVKVYDMNGIISTILDKPTFRFAFHTSFINGFCLDLPKNQLDETNGAFKATQFPPDFSIRVMFGDVPANHVHIQASSSSQSQQQIPLPPPPQASNSPQSPPSMITNGSNDPNAIDSDYSIL